MQYYYISDGQNTIGPLSKLKLISQNITKETLVWSEGLSEWKKAGDIEELADLFSSKQIPSPLPRQATPIHPFSESVYHRNYTMSGAESSQKKRSTKKIVFWSAGVFLLLSVLAVMGYFVYVQVQTDNIKSNEYLHPEWYLSLETENADFNILTGSIYNSSKYTTYEQIQIVFSYYDKKGNVLQSNVYTIDGTYYPQSDTPFEVKIRLPQGVKNFIKTKKCSIDIIGAGVKYN